MMYTKTREIDKYNLTFVNNRRNIEEFYFDRSFRQDEYETYICYYNTKAFQKEYNYVYTYTHITKYCPCL